MTLKSPELLPACRLARPHARGLRFWRRRGVCRPAARYSLRARNNEFRIEQIQTGIEEAHARGKSSS